MEDREWYMGSDGNNNIAALLRRMRDSGDGLDLDRAIEIIERPWRWAEEWKAYRAIADHVHEVGGCRDCPYDRSAR